MSASVARPSPARQQLVDSLLITPPDLTQLWGSLREATINAGYAAANVDNCKHHNYGPDDEALEEAEQACLMAYLALAAYRAQ